MYGHVKVAMFPKILQEMFLLWFRSLVQVPWSYSSSFTGVYSVDLVVEHFSLAFERILTTNSFLERTNWSTSGRSSQQAGRKCSLFCARHYLCSRFYFFSKCFLMLFRDSLCSTETESNALMLEVFSYNFWLLYETLLIKSKRFSKLWLIVGFQFVNGTGFLNTWLRQDPPEQLRNNRSKKSSKT